uniref:Cell division protein n=1 Tax=Chlamydomonas peterfii TaxID=28462 RepID=A0A0S2IC80_9CHLO|nr:cell division protein [Chlamydomonas peterfii]
MFIYKKDTIKKPFFLSKPYFGLLQIRTEGYRNKNINVFYGLAGYITTGDSPLKAPLRLNFLDSRNPKNQLRCQNTGSGAFNLLANMPDYGFNFFIYKKIKNPGILYYSRYNSYTSQPRPKGMLTPLNLLRPAINHLQTPALAQTNKYKSVLYRPFNMEIIQKLLLDMPTSIATNNPIVESGPTAYAGLLGNQNQYYAKDDLLNYQPNTEKTKTLLRFRLKNKANIGAKASKIKWPELGKPSSTTLRVAGTNPNIAGYVKAGRSRTEIASGYKKQTPETHKVLCPSGVITRHNPYTQTYKTYNLFQSIIVSFLMPSASKYTSNGVSELSLQTEPLYGGAAFSFLRKQNSKNTASGLEAFLAIQNQPQKNTKCPPFGHKGIKLHRKAGRSSSAFFDGLAFYSRNASYWLLPLIGLFTVMVPKAAYTPNTPSMPLWSRCSFAATEKKEKSFDSASAVKKNPTGQTNYYISGNTSNVPSDSIIRRIENRGYGSAVENFKTLPGQQSYNNSYFNQLYKVLVGFPDIINVWPEALQLNSISRQTSLFSSPPKGHTSFKNLLSSEGPVNLTPEKEPFILNSAAKLHLAVNGLDYGPAGQNTWLLASGHETGTKPGKNFKFTENTESDFYKEPAITAPLDFAFKTTRPEAYYALRAFKHKVVFTYGPAGYKNVLTFLNNFIYRLNWETLTTPPEKTDYSGAVSMPFGPGFLLNSTDGSLKANVTLYTNNLGTKFLRYKKTASGLFGTNRPEAYQLESVDSLWAKIVQYGLDVFLQSKQYALYNAQPAKTFNKLISGQAVFNITNTVLLNQKPITAFSMAEGLTPPQKRFKSFFGLFTLEPTLLEKNSGHINKTLWKKKKKLPALNFLRPAIKNLKTPLLGGHKKAGFIKLHNTATPAIGTTSFTAPPEKLYVRLRPKKDTGTSLSTISLLSSRPQTVTAELEKYHGSNSLFKTPAVNVSGAFNNIKFVLATLRNKLNNFVKLNNYNTIQLRRTILANYLPNADKKLIGPPAIKHFLHSQDKKTKKINKYKPFISQNSMPIVLQNQKFFILKPFLYGYAGKNLSLCRNWTSHKLYGGGVLNKEVFSTDSGFEKLQELNKYKKDMQKKRKAKKQRFEARRKTKRRRFYPRPNWLRLRLGLYSYAGFDKTGTTTALNFLRFYGGASAKNLKTPDLQYKTSVKPKYTLPVTEINHRKMPFLYSYYLNNYIQTLAKANFFGVNVSGAFKLTDSTVAFNNLLRSRFVKRNKADTYKMAGNITTYNTLLYNLWLANKKNGSSLAGKPFVKNFRLIYNSRMPYGRGAKVNVLQPEMLGTTSKKSLINFKKTANYASFEDKSKTPQPGNIQKKENINNFPKDFWIWLYNLTSTNQLTKQIYVNNILNLFTAEPEIPIVYGKSILQKNNLVLRTAGGHNVDSRPEAYKNVLGNKTLSSLAHRSGEQAKVDPIRILFNSREKSFRNRKLFLTPKSVNLNSGVALKSPDVLVKNGNMPFGRVKWSLNQTNLWASTNQRVNFWSTQKLRRQSQNNKTKYIEKTFKQYLTNLFTNLKLKAFFVSSNRLETKKEDNNILPVNSNRLKNHKLSISQKMHQKQVKLSYITSGNTALKKLKVNLTENPKGFLTKPEFFWFENSNFGSVAGSRAVPKNALSILTGQPKIFNSFLPDAALKNLRTRLSFFKTPLPNKALSEQQILNTQTVNSYWPITIFALLFHFSALISLISISQIRCFIKFHLILVYKLSGIAGNLYLQLIYKNLKVLTKVILPTTFDVNRLSRNRISAFSAPVTATPFNGGFTQPNKSFGRVFFRDKKNNSRNLNLTGKPKKAFLNFLRPAIKNLKPYSKVIFKKDRDGFTAEKIKASYKNYNTPEGHTQPDNSFFTAGQANFTSKYGVFKISKKDKAVDGPKKAYKLSNFLITFLLFFIKKQSYGKSSGALNTYVSNPAELYSAGQNLIRLRRMPLSDLYKSLKKLDKNEIRPAGPIDSFFVFLYSFLYISKNVSVTLNYEVISTLKKRTYDTTLQIVDSFESFLRLIYGFFEKPAELTMDWIAYAFLVEWSSDLLTFTPENKDKQNWLAFAKFSRQVQPFVYGGAGIFWISGLASKTPAFINNVILRSQTRWGLGPTFLLSTVVGQFLYKRLLYLNDMFIEILNRPDTDLMNRQKKGTLFWDIWSDILIKAADQYNINIPSLYGGAGNIKEEQNLLIDKLLYSTTSGASNFEKPNFETATGLVIAKTTYGVTADYIQKKGVFTSKNQAVNQTSTANSFFKPENLLGLSRSDKHKFGRALIDWQYNPKYCGYAYRKNFLSGVKDLPEGLYGGLDLFTSKKIKSAAELLTWNPPAMVTSQKSLKAPFITEFVTYQSKETDLFLDYHPPKSFKFTVESQLTTSARKRTGLSIQYYNLVQQPIGLLVCQIYAGIFRKQISKNILVIGSKTNTSAEPADLRIQKTLLIQALAGETEIQMITDNAQRYAIVNRGFAVGIKLLKEVFESLALNTPCLFLLEDIHLIGERRPLLIDNSLAGLGDEMSKSTEIAFGAQRNGDAVHEKNQVLYQYNRHGITHYQKPFKGDFSLSIPTNHFAFDLFSPRSGKQRNSNVNDASQTPINPLSYATLSDQQSPNFNTEGSNAKSQQTTSHGNAGEKSLHKKRNYYSSAESFLQQSGQKKLLYGGAAPPSTSPFAVLLLKEQKKLKPKKIVKELPWVGLPSEQFALLPRVSYSVRAKVSALADLSFSNMSAKFDMITDLLVIIDSVRGNRGFVVFATTHLPHILDPALRRPGRLDETISIPTLSNLWNRWEFIKVPQPLIYGYDVAGNITRSGFKKFTSKFDAVKPNFVNTAYGEAGQDFIYGLAGNNFVVGQSPNGTLDSLDFLNLDILPSLSGSKTALSAKEKNQKLFASKNDVKTYTGKPIPIALQPDAASLPSYALTNRPHTDLITSLQQRRETPANSKTRSTWTNTAYYQMGRKFIRNWILLPFLPVQNSGKNRKHNGIKSKNAGMCTIWNLFNFSPLYNNHSYTDIASTLLTENIEYLSTEIQYKSIYSATHIIQNTLIGLISGKFCELFAFQTMPMLGLYNFGDKNINNKNTRLRQKPSAVIDFYSSAGVNQYKQNTTNGSSTLTAGCSLAALKTNLVGKLGKKHCSITLYGIDQTWRAAMTLAISFVQKRYLYHKNLIVPKLLNFLNYSSLEEAPSPPSSNILIPAKRYESYKKVLKENIELNLYNNPPFGGSSQVLSTKIEKHLKQSYIKSIYTANLKSKANRSTAVIPNNGFTADAASLSLRPETKQTQLSRENSRFLETIPNQYGGAGFIQTPNISWYYENKLLKRHKNYLKNQWWNGQLIEHNAETLFLSDIDWRYTFYYGTSSGKSSVRTPKDILLDFPDSDQHYNPKHRRWLLNAGYWSSWFDLDRKLQTDILNHFIFECFITSYTILNRNRELLDYSVTKYMQKGLIKEINMIGLISRLSGVAVYGPLD